MKNRFLILILKVFGSFDIEFFNRDSIYGSYYYSIHEKKIIQYQSFHYKTIKDDCFIKYMIKTKKLYYEI